MNIQELKAKTIIGNAMSDACLLEDIHCFIVDTDNTLADRLAAMRRLDEVMGVDCPYPTEEELVQYMEECDV